MKIKNTKTRRLAALLMSAVMLFALAGCSSEKEEKKDPLPPKEEVLSYVQTGLKEIADLESKALDSFDSVTAENFTNDQDMLKEISKTTLPTAKKLLEASEKLGKNIQLPELKETHAKYTQGCEKLVKMLETVVDALKKQDASKIQDANAMQTEISSLWGEYGTELLELAEKYEISAEDIQASMGK